MTATTARDLLARASEFDLNDAQRVLSAERRKDYSGAGALWLGDVASPSDLTKSLRAQERGAASYMITYKIHGWDAVDSIECLADLQLRTLAVAYAHSRARGHQQNRSAGIVLLAGEITARAIHRDLVATHGEQLVRPLTDLIRTIWPLTGDDLRNNPGSGHPPLQATRMLTGPCRELFEPWQTRALQPLISTYTRAGDTAPQMLATALTGMARMAHESLTPLLKHRGQHVIAARDDILSARMPRRPRPMDDADGGNR